MNIEEKGDFFEYLMSNSELSAEEAMALTEYKALVKQEVEGLEKSIRLGKMIPLPYITDWDTMNDGQRKKVLWEMGMDTRKYRYVVDVQCYRDRGKRTCGKVVYCSERVDKEWLNKVVEGVNVASLEARYWWDRDELEVMKGNKSVSKA